MLADLWGIEWLFWWQIPLVVIFVVVGVFGGGALLWVGGRFLAQVPAATFWRSVGTNLLVSVVMGVLSLFGLPLGWLIIKGMFRTTYGKAILAWLPTLPIAFLGAGLTAAILVPTLQQANELTNRTICMSNLSGVGRAITLYKMRNDRRYPPTLKVLIEAGQPSKYFRCPSARRSRREPGWRIDYFYLPPKPDTNRDRLMVCDFRENHRGQRNVLRVGMVVDRLTEAEFQAELARPANADFAKALREIEGP